MNQEHCAQCGRPLIEVVERDGYDPESGEARTRSWRQCPRFPRNGFVALFRGLHDSYDAANTILARDWH